MAENGGSTAVCTSADTESQSCNTNGCCKSTHVCLLLFVQVLSFSSNSDGFFKVLMPSGLYGVPGEAAAKRAVEG